eukprot:65769-Chlamydomonas_euryale.AAC.2
MAPFPRPLHPTSLAPLPRSSTPLTPAPLPGPVPRKCVEGVDAAPLTLTPLPYAALSLHPPFRALARPSGLLHAGVAGVGAAGRRRVRPQPVRAAPGGLAARRAAHALRGRPGACDVAASAGARGRRAACVGMAGGG